MEFLEFLSVFFCAGTFFKADPWRSVRPRQNSPSKWCPSPPPKCGVPGLVWSEKMTPQNLVFWWIFLFWSLDWPIFQISKEDSMIPSPLPSLLLLHGGPWKEARADFFDWRGFNFSFWTPGKALWLQVFSLSKAVYHQLLNSKFSLLNFAMPSPQGHSAAASTSRSSNDEKEDDDAGGGREDDGVVFASESSWHGPLLSIKKCPIAMWKNQRVLAKKQCQAPKPKEASQNSEKTWFSMLKIREAAEAHPEFDLPTFTFSFSALVCFPLGSLRMRCRFPVRSSSWALSGCSPKWVIGSFFSKSHISNDIQ